MESGVYSHRQRSLFQSCPERKSAGHPWGGNPTNPHANDGDYDDDDKARTECPSVCIEPLMQLKWNSWRDQNSKRQGAHQTTSSTDSLGFQIQQREHIRSLEPYQRVAVAMQRRFWAGDEC